MNKHNKYFSFIFIVYAFSFLFVVSFCRAEKANYPRPQLYEHSQQLTKNWEFVRGDLGGVWETLRSVKLSRDLPVWQPVELPHCYNAFDCVDPDAAYYQGPAWYRTKLKIENPYPNGRTLLHFEGAGQKTEVYIDTQKAGSHIGGYDEFVIDITDAAEAFKANPVYKENSEEHIPTKGMIPLSIRCDNSRDVEMIPSDLSDFCLYGGIYRNLNLVYVPAISLERVHIQTQRQANGDWSLKVSGQLYNPQLLKDKLSIAIQILTPDGSREYQSEKTLEPWSQSAELFETNIATPVLWSPGSPNLYQCVVTLKSSQGQNVVSERFGLRQFEFVEKGPFKLNGERLLLRGTHWQEDSAGFGAAQPDELVRKTFQLMKEMGVNYIRLGHHQQSQLVLDLCDQTGILVWEEIPWCRGGLGGDRYQRQAKDMLTAMIDQHFNHPSIIIWGLGNENDWPGDFETFDKEKIRAFMSELNDLSHKLDPQRKTAIRRCAFCSDIVDVYSPSVWPGWYSKGSFTGYKQASEKEMAKVNRFVHMEWGGDSQARRHSETPYKLLEKSGNEIGADYLNIRPDVRVVDDGDWSETYICDLMDWILKEQETMDWLAGTALWTFTDFSTPLRPDNPIPFVNQKGVVERDLTPKESYYVFQSYWTDKPMVRIYAHTWPVRWGKKGEKKLVKVYSNCNDVELFVNGESAGIKKRNSQDFPAAGLRWEAVFKEGMNNLKAVAVKGDVKIADEITLRYETCQWGAPAKLILNETLRDGDTSTVKATLLDANGVICLDARNFVRFGLTGDGKLLDNLGTSRGSRKVQLYNGVAMIDVKFNQGSSVISVSCEGLSTAFLTLEKKKNNDAANVLTQKTSHQKALETAQIDRDRIIRLADFYLNIKPISIRDYPAPFDQARPGDYYSMGDYWWPNPKTKDGLPYIQKDGQSNPDNFTKHRMLVMKLKDAVASLAAGYALEGNEKYVKKAVQLLEVFFLNEKTKMNPHLLYAQAVPGKATGRGTGIIDTLHLAEVTLAIEVLQKSTAMKPEILSGLKRWFADYTEWMTTHPYGLAEMNAKNNHSVAYFLQLAAFAKFTGDEKKLEMARKFYKEILLPYQMDMDGSFPLELERTKPYGYSIFQLDNIVLLCQLLRTQGDDIWNYTLKDGRCVEKGMEFLFKYLKDKDRWPYPHDVLYYDQWPVRQPCLLFAGYAMGHPEYLNLWKTLDTDPANPEVRRNMAATQPLLWFMKMEEVPLFKTSPNL
ncbi:MAG: alginate lyase family protein [Phycisphaerae bacterium]